jgi:hypothetical protein
MSTIFMEVVIWFKALLKKATKNSTATGELMVNIMA